MSKVYVVQNHASYDKSSGLMVPRFDLSPAEEFGELVFLLSPINTPSKAEKAIEELKRKLKDFSDDAQNMGAPFSGRDVFFNPVCKNDEPNFIVILDRREGEYGRQFSCQAAFHLNLSAKCS